MCGCTKKSVKRTTVPTIKTPATTYVAGTLQKDATVIVKVLGLNGLYTSVAHGEIHIVDCAYYTLSVHDVKYLQKMGYTIEYLSRSQ